MIPGDTARAASDREAARRSRILADECTSPELRDHYSKQAARLEDAARLKESNTNGKA